MRGCAVFLVVCLASIAPLGSSRAADGDLDPTFGGTGVVTVPFSDLVQDAGGIALQSDAIVVAGRVASTYGGLGSLALARYDGGGVPDPAFGSGGLVTTLLSGEAPWDVVVHQDGSLYVLRVGGGDILLSHFSSTGNLDPSFGSGGTVTTDCGGSEGAGFLVLQPDGKLVVGVSTSAATTDACVVRYEPDGSLDGAFGTAGIARIADFRVTDLALQTDGKILVAGGKYVAPPNTVFAIARLQADGAIDASFGASGVATTEQYPIAVGVAAQPDGRIVAASVGFALVRYRPDGSADNTFGTAGISAPVIVGGADAYGPVDLAIQGDGKILVGGIAFVDIGPPLNGVVDQFVLVRYGNDGALDPSYGVGGVKENVTTARMTALRLQPDGKALAVGSVISTPLGTGWRIARLLGFSHPCPATPALGCKGTIAPQAARFKIRRTSPSSKNQLQWQWTGEATMLADFGNPGGGDDYALCLYDESGMGSTLLSHAIVAGGGTCTGKPCWKALGTSGLGYSDSRRVAFGIRSIKLKAGIAGKAQIQVKGQGAWLAPPSLPLGSPLRVQLSSQGGACWESVFSSAHTSKNDAERFQGKSD